MNNLVLTGRVTFRMLRYFSAVAAELHFGRAAQLLNISQPPLSVQIKDLEDALGYALFDRDSRNVTLTKAGLVAKREIDTLLLQMDQAFNRIERVAREDHHHLELGLLSSTASFVINMMLGIEKKQPELSWSISEMPAAQQLKSLQERTLDICFMRNFQPQAGLSSIQLLQDPILLAVSATHPLAKSEGEISLSHLSEQLFVFLIVENSFDSIGYIQSCEQQGFFPKITHEVSEFQTLLSLVQANKGIAFVPKSYSVTYQQNVCYLPLVEKLYANIDAVYLKDEHSSVVNRIIDELMRVQI